MIPREDVPTPPKALTIAGSDSGGGAGIQADLKTFAALGVYGSSVVTAVTAQNTRGVFAVAEVPEEVIAIQIDVVLEDIGAAAAKTGMLSSASIVETVADRLEAWGVEKLVVDPVMVAKGGHPLLQQSAVTAVKQHLLPLALVVTPNIPEAEVLSGITVDSPDAAREAARAIAALGPRWVVIKGGHLAGDATDLVYDGETLCGVPRRAHRHPEHPRHRLHLLGRHRGLARSRAAAAGGDRGGQDLVDRGDPGELRDRRRTFAGQPFPRGRPGSACSGRSVLRGGRRCRGEGSGGRSCATGWRSTSSPIRSKPIATSWRMVDDALAGGVTSLQLRAKRMPGREMYDLAVALRERCRSAGALFFVNDRVDIAVAADADGVHVGDARSPAARPPGAWLAAT